MRKEVMLLIALMVISVGFLSGCNESIIDEVSDKFIGTWGSQEGYQPIIITFFSDKTCSIEDLNGETVYGTWEISEEKLVMTLKGQTVIFSYSFYSEDTILSLTEVSSQQYVLYTKNYSPSKSAEITTISMNLFSQNDATNTRIWLVSGIEGEAILDTSYNAVLLNAVGEVDSATITFNEVTGPGYVNAGDTFTVVASGDGYFTFMLSDTATGSTIYKSPAAKY